MGKRRKKSEKRKKRNKIRIIDYDDIGKKVHLEKPVILVDDICMDFKVAMQNVSGKSTLLKIISGALTPTAGTVAVDRSKIQILALRRLFEKEWKIPCQLTGIMAGTNTIHNAEADMNEVMLLADGYGERY